MDDIVGLCALVGQECAARPGQARPGHAWPPILGLFKSIVVTLTYLRRNRVQAELAESFSVPSRRSAEPLATGYRGRLAELPAVIRIVVRLQFYRLGW